FRFGEVLFLTDDSSGDSLAIDCVRDENSLAIVAPDAFASESNVVDREVRQAHGRMFGDTVSVVESAAVRVVILRLAERTE
ncbi:MAG: hypothetical protein ABI871_01820, partial [Chthoniobacterales bacterium]